MNHINKIITDARSIVNNIVSNALWEMIYSLLVPFVTTTLLVRTNIPMVVSGIILLLSLIGLVSLIIRYRHIDFKYMFLKKTIYFEYRESYSIYRTEHMVKALTNNVDRFYGRYTWDYDKVEMRCTAPANSTITPLPIDDTYQKYDVYFGGRKYNIGDKYHVNLESKMNGELLFPLFATTIIKPTNHLKIHIKLPLHLLKSNKIRLVTSPTPSEVGVSKTEDATLDKFGEYIWSITSPKLTYEYAIEWDFIDEKQVISKS